MHSLQLLSERSLKKGKAMKSLDHILFGAAYYDEYQPSSNLDADMQLMRKAHINVIRVGEGSWSHWEPEDGQFSLDWLEPVLDKAAENNIQAIIGVPTFAIPQWMVRKYPEIALSDDHGQKVPFGSREEHSYSHPVFRYYAARLIGKIVDRYAGHPSVIGWQLHNEPGLRLNYSTDAFEGFKDYLRKEYGSVEHLNRAWGLTYWSHELSTWDDLWKPEGNCQPQYDIAWHRYQALLTDDMLAWQSRLIRQHCRSDQFITVNMALGREAVDEARSSEHLDVAGSDPYFHMQDGLQLPEPDMAEDAWYPSGPWTIAQMADRTYSLKSAPFFVLETDGGPIGGSADNFPGYKGQWRQAGWQFVSRGADLIEYWHWQQLHYGTEMYWGGILPHDRKPGRVYAEISQLGGELAAAGDAVTDLKPDADVAILYSVGSRWGLTFEPYTAINGAGDAHRARNAGSYDHMLTAFYRGAFRTGHQVRMIQDTHLIDGSAEKPVVAPTAFVNQYPLLLVPGAYICSDALLSWLREYVKAGGHLVLGPRTAYADQYARARMETKPSMLDDLAGADYQEFSNIKSPISVKGTDSFKLRPGSAATEWIDCLQSKGAEILATSNHPHFSQFPLITSHVAGQGRVTMIGTVPNEALAASLFDYLLPDDPWLAGQTTISHSSAVNRYGRRLHFLFNWSWQTHRIAVPVSCTLLGKNEPLSSVELGPWDVVLLQETQVLPDNPMDSGR